MKIIFGNNIILEMKGSDSAETELLCVQKREFFYNNFR